MANLKGSRLQFTILVVSLTVLVTCAIAQQTPQSPVPLSVTKLRDNVYWLEGGGAWPIGNSGIIVGNTGVIVVDPKSTLDAGKALLAEIAKITPKPVTHVILTHSDGDHVNGIVAFPSNLTIIAQENNKKEQEEAIAAGRRAVPAVRLPTRVVKNKEALTIDGVKFELLHWVPANTAGDLVIFLPEQKIAFTGDLTATNHPDPSLHLEKQGSAAGWLESARGIAALDADIFIPGHLGMQTKADVHVRLKSAEGKRSKVAELIKQGKSWEEIKAAMGDARLSGDRPSFVEISYRELAPTLSR